MLYGILKNNETNYYVYGWMRTFLMELIDIDYKRSLKSI